MTPTEESRRERRRDNILLGILTVVLFVWLVAGGAFLMGGG